MSTLSIEIIAIFMCCISEHRLTSTMQDSLVLTALFLAISFDFCHLARVSDNMLFSDISVKIIIFTCIKIFLLEVTNTCVA